MTAIVTVSAIVLAVVSLLWIGLLPRTFFRRGRLNVQWWLNSVPFWLAGLALLAALVGPIPQPRLPASLQAIAAAISIGLSLAALALLAATLAAHRRPLALWHQHDDTPAHLVTDGPYAYVRHPFYASFLLTLAACALAVPHWTTILAATYGWYRLNATARREEGRFCESPLGGRYRAYMRRVGRFAPRMGWPLDRRRSAETDAGPWNETSEPLQQEGSQEREFSGSPIARQTERAVRSS